MLNVNGWFVDVALSYFTAPLCVFDSSPSRLGCRYVFLAASSSFKGKSDLQKYEKARRLKKHIEPIRKHYERLLQSSDAYERQSGTAMWIIDRLALRVGGEKVRDEDEAKRQRK